MASCGGSSSSNSGGTGSPCGACKFLRRKCAVDCVFAPYFCSEQGAARFAAIHKVFGASNVSKLLLHVPVADRCEAVVTIAYEAQARIRDPVYGCVAHIFALQQQVTCLQTQLIQAKAQLAQTYNTSNHHQHYGSSSAATNHNHNHNNVYHNNNNNNYVNNNYPISPQSSLDSVDQTGSSTHDHHQISMINGGSGGGGHQEIQSGRVVSSEDYNNFLVQPNNYNYNNNNNNCSRKRPNNNGTELGELHALALRMMRN
ncbi:hypothetical protein CsatA_014845 [Cannabis sativa]